MLTLLRWLTDGSWGDPDHVPPDQCPWRDHGHNTLLLSHRPPSRPWRRIYELRCVSCTLVVVLPPGRHRYDRKLVDGGSAGSHRRWRLGR